jgi:YVTN family beta-propeller protein
MNKSVMTGSLGLALAAALMACSPKGGGGAATNTTTTTTTATAPAPGSAGQAIDIYRNTTSANISPAVVGALHRIYVPNIGSNDIYVIDPDTDKVVDHYRVGANPQHVVPSYDLKTLWVTGSAGKAGKPGSLTSIDPTTGKATREIAVPDAYNMYYTPDGKYAIVVAEKLKALEFRDPQTMELKDRLAVPGCPGLNHADYSPDGSYAIFTCEFSGGLAKIDIRNRKVLGYLKLENGGMPQDIRSSPSGDVFYVANMMTDGVHLIDGASFREIGFIPTGVGAHGLYPSRDGKLLYVANRGSHMIAGRRKGPGSVSVIDFATRQVIKTWPIPGGGSPDMGNVSADGKKLWLAGRFDDEAYDIDTTTGQVTKIKVGHTPHGIAVWPQPGSYSLGHTGVMR